MCCVLVPPPNFLFVFDRPAKSDALLQLSELNGGDHRDVIQRALQMQIPECLPGLPLKSSHISAWKCRVILWQWEAQYDTIELGEKFHFHSIIVKLFQKKLEGTEAEL